MPDVPIKVIGARPVGAPRPKVSVAMVTYRQEKFIEQAVGSVMLQETIFPFELVIGEDCSPDRTREIVLRLQSKYPDRIRLLLPEKNVGMMANFIQTLKACDGQYVALLEGDDYWTDPHKLQKQVDLLEAHPEYSGCFALTRVVSGDDSAGQFYIPARHTSVVAYTTEDLLQKNPIATASVMCRNVMRQVNFAPLLPLKMIDWPLHVFVSLGGPIGYIPEEMACYRQHDGGIWTSADLIQKLEANIQMFDALRCILPKKHHRAISASTIKAYQLIAIEQLRKGDRRTCCTSAFKSLTSIPVPELMSLTWHVRRSATLLVGGFFLSPSTMGRLLR
jgi:glycosyltransferase involved in cell wall biosynthesis